MNSARVAVAKAWLDTQAPALPQALRAALVDGVAQPRGSALEAAEGWLGVAQVRSAANAFGRASPAQQQAFVAAFNAAPAEQRWVLLKAMGARGIDAATAFAPKVSGLSGAALLARTTLIDLNQGDGKATGLAQRWSGSCVPTSLELARGEADPIFAFECTAVTLSDGQARDALADAQRALLEAHGGVAVGREDQGGAGIAYDDIDDVAGEQVGMATHLRYQEVSLDYQPPAARARRLQEVAALLEDGVDVPVTMPGHCLLLTDSRVGPDGNRRFLMQDPWSATSLWVTEAQLVKDGFGLKDFVEHTNLNRLYTPA